MEVLMEMRFAREDRASGAAVQGDFETSVTAVQHAQEQESRKGGKKAVVENGMDTRRDKVMHMTGDFESAVAAIAVGQHGRTDEVGLGTLARTARSYSSIQQWRRKNI